MRTLRDYIVEVLRPCAPGERQFFDQHTVKQNFKGPTGSKEDRDLFTARNIKVAPFKGRAGEPPLDDEAAEDEEKNESVERVDEISRGLAHRYAIKSAEQQSHDNSLSIGLGNEPGGEERHKVFLGRLQRRFEKRAQGLDMANKRLGRGRRVNPKF